MRLLARLFAAILLLIGLGLALGGAWLAALGGSPYYVLVGLAYMAAAFLAWRGRAAALWLMAAIMAATLAWALWEARLDYWALFPRLMAPLALTGLGLAFLPSLVRTGARKAAYAGAGACGLAFAALFAFAFVPHGAIMPAAGAAYPASSGSNGPDNWTSYGKTTEGLRYTAYTQINRENISKLRPAWTFRTGDSGPGIDQNTPLQIGDTLYTCSRNNRIAAIDGDSGKPRWTFDPQARSPIWQRCRSLAYFHDDASAANAPCADRIIATTIDARLFALDARTGARCPGFGQEGMVALSQGMGPIKPGYYFQTSGPLVARNLIIIGGWVVDNQEVGEPSGVIRAFDVRSGELAWAWDLGNPAITKLPPPGQTYTRGTPNMWTTAAYDDRLGLIYLPLGNATPDYYGVGRAPWADAYNATLVALDVATGRERWKFQTVHHDIWDYDLPAQPALIDVADGRGGKVPALLLPTKRGQLFLLNRATGAPLAEVAEKPVTQVGAAPGERLSPTQPYSVGMPVIGAMRLSEKRAWGMTMFDQLACRISFRQHRYDGDFTPIGLRKALEQPSNVGGLNWGSLSVDVATNRVFMNDIRTPASYRLVPRADYPAYSKKVPSDGTGHGPSPQAGTPYGMGTMLWMSGLGVPCVQPPFGTITAIDLDSRRIAWQVPAGTAEELGPLGLKLGLPMPIGMPTYAGTSVTAGGLLFFAGSQDFYLRAYDAATGRELWKHPLPVGSSATPMTYISPRTGRQYVVVSVGGAAHSEAVGDYVMAFALPPR